MDSHLSSMTFRFYTFFTDAPELQPALFHMAAVPDGIHLQSKIFQWDHHIQNAAAVFAYKMTVRYQFRVKTVCSICCDLPDLPKLY